MINPFPTPRSSLARLILLPGEFSDRTSRSGMASPALTNAGHVRWKKAFRTGPGVQGARDTRWTVDLRVVANMFEQDE